MNQYAFSQIEYLIPRILFTGIEWGQVMNILNSLPDQNQDSPAKFWMQWQNIWSEHAKSYDDQANTALERGKTKTADTLFQKAVSCLHWADFMSSHNSDEKRWSKSKQTAIFKRRLKTSDLPIIPASFGTCERKVNGYLIKPDESPVKHCIIHLNGLNTSTEVEIYTFARSFVERGLSCFIFDDSVRDTGLNNGTTELCTEHLIDQAIGYLRKNELCESAVFGLFGVSFGGMLALRTAIRLSYQIRATICLSGGINFDHFSALGPKFKNELRYALEQSNDEETQAILQKKYAIKASERITGSVLAIHGTKDRFFPIAQCNQIKGLVENEFKQIVYEGEGHVCQNRLGDYVPIMADWMCNQLN